MESEMSKTKIEGECEKKQTVISEKTLLPLGVVVVLIGGIAWITNLSFQANASAKSVEKVITRLDEISDRLSRIEGKLGVDKKGAQ